MAEGIISSTEIGIKHNLDSEKQKKEVILPKTPENFRREEGLDAQEAFSTRVKDIVMVPTRAELKNGNLLNFLDQLDSQSSLGKDKVGIVMLVNDRNFNTRSPEELEGLDDSIVKALTPDNPEVFEENRLTAQFLSSLSKKDLPTIEALPLSKDYKEAAKQILKKDQLEMRLDYIHATRGGLTDFSALRSHLFNLANVFHNENTPDKDVVLHMSDMDITYSSSHIAELRKFYADKDNSANITDEDFVPGVHEGSKEEDITKDMLTTIDDFRLLWNLEGAFTLLSGEIMSGTPMMSGRLSYFMPDGQLAPEFQEALDVRGRNNEDFRLGKAIKDKSIKTNENLGNIGEVYRQQRARTADEKPRTDAEEVYAMTKLITEQKSGKAPSLDWDAKIHELTQLIDQTQNGKSFMKSEEYQKLLDAELQKEELKTRLRRVRLFSFIESIANKHDLTESEEKIAAPYREYFQEETDSMKDMLASGQTPEEVGVKYLKKYDSFFNSNNTIHMQIAVAQALKHYVFKHNIVSDKDHKGLPKPLQQPEG